MPRQEFEIEIAVIHRLEANSGAIEDIHLQGGVVGLDDLGLEFGAANSRIALLCSLHRDLARVDHGAKLNAHFKFFIVQLNRILLPEVGAQANRDQFDANVAFFIDGQSDRAGDFIGYILGVRIDWIGCDIDIVFIEKAVELEVDGVGQNAAGTAQDEEQGIALEGGVDGPGAKRGDRHARHEMCKPFHFRSPLLR